MKNCRRSVRHKEDGLVGGRDSCMHRFVGVKGRVGGREDGYLVADESCGARVRSGHFCAACARILLTPITSEEEEEE